MRSEKTAKYVAFLRGINVGGHHKVPMADLRKAMEDLNCKNVITILNSGNIIFEISIDEIDNLEENISNHLENTFGFSIPTILIKVSIIKELTDNNPFQNELLTQDIRWYVTFLKKENKTSIQLPFESEDKSFRIIDKNDKIIFSVLDISITKTPIGMNAIEKLFGKDITTRNWKTIERIGKKT